MNNTELILYFMAGFCLGASLIFIYWFFYARDLQKKLEQVEANFNEIYRIAIKMHQEDAPA